MGKRLWDKIRNNQVARFILSAGLGFLVDISAFYILFHNVFTEKTYSVASLNVSNYSLAFAISYCSGVVVNFTITKYMVFSESKSSPLKQFLRFVSVAIIGYFANLALIELFVNSFNLYPPIARPAAALSLFFASFFVHKFFSFSLSLRHHTTANKTA